jgi:hypothetical protein
LSSQDRRAFWASSALYLGIAAFLLRQWLQPGVLPGHANSEAPQRLWELHQLLRWFSGETPFGHADLIAFPDGRPFWPAMPIADLLMLPMVGALGDALAFSVVALALLTLAGIGPYVLARGLGARAPASFAAGLLLLLNPMMLRNLEDCVLEMACLGLPCLAAAAMIQVMKGQRRAWIGVFVWTALTAFSSPYFAVFLALACLPVAALTWRRWRTWLAIVGVCVTANLSALLPLALVEGDAGRMGHEGGFVVAPPPIVYPGGATYRGPTGPHSSTERSDPAKGPQAKPSPLLRVLARWPAGVLACLGLLLGLGHRKSRPWAVMGIAFFALGPGVPSLSRAFGQGGQSLEGPLQRLLSALPLMDVLGNPTRMLLLVSALAALAWAQLLQHRWPLAIVLALGVGGELWMLRPDLSLPSRPDPTDVQVVQALSAPYLVVPSGHPPLWMPGLARGEALLYGGRAQVPHAYDLGLGQGASDVVAVLELAVAARLPLAQPIALMGRPEAVDWARLPQRQVVVVHAVLEPKQRLELEAALAPIGRRVVQGTQADLWQLRDP